MASMVLVYRLHHYRDEWCAHGQGHAVDYWVGRELLLGRMHCVNHVLLSKLGLPDGTLQEAPVDLGGCRM